MVAYMIAFLISRFFSESDAPRAASGSALATTAPLLSFRKSRRFMEFVMERPSSGVGMVAVMNSRVIDVLRHPRALGHVALALRWSLVKNISSRFAKNLGTGRTV